MYKKLKNADETAVTAQNKAPSEKTAIEQRRSSVEEKPAKNEPRKSLMFPRKSLSGKETRYLEFVGQGDVMNVKKILDSPPTAEEFDLNCQDLQGNSALHLAVKKGDEKMANLLLSRKGLDPRDCALHAVKLNHPRILTMILEKVRRSFAINLEFSACTDSPDFPDYLTPLMLAAQCGHVEIINLLLYREHEPLQSPHTPSCICESCLSDRRDRDPLELATYKLDLYKAICNPAYICQQTNDPILLVFQLVVELREMAEGNRVFLRKYEELIEETEQFAADLIALCRTSPEVNTVLNQEYGANIRGDILFPRLILAVDYKQKQFVAQRNVQEVIEAAWIGDYYAWKSFSDSRTVVQFVGRVAMLPLIYFFCIFLPKSRWARFYAIPINRMLSSVASYFVFLFLLFLEANRDRRNQTRYDILDNVPLIVAIFLFEITHFISSGRMVYKQGAARYFSFKWNLYDLITDIFFVTTFLCWGAALFIVLTQPDIERKNWDSLDPQLFYEGFFCISTVMAFSRLLLLLQIHGTLGPMQVSLSQMTKDLWQFMIIFAIVLGSFTAGMCRLYQYYDGMKQIDPDTKDVSRQESSFVSPMDTFNVLFWGLFCMSSQDAGEVVIENLPNEEGELVVIVHHDFTQAVGYTLFAVYTVLTVIMLVNMLIAAMSNTFQNITDNVDVEWIFGRTEVYLAYMSQTVIPPPLNWLEPLTNTLAACFSKVFHKWVVDKDLEKEGEKQEDFEEVMKRLVQRYFSQKKEEEEGKGD